MKYLHFKDLEGRDLVIPSSGLLAMRSLGINETQLYTTGAGFAVQCPLQEHLDQLEIAFGSAVNMKPHPEADNNG